MILNQNAYGMWFTPPDIGITVLCVFANGDRQLGYYIGVVPDNGLGHMVPAIGSSAKYICICYALNCNGVGFPRSIAASFN